MSVQSYLQINISQMKKSPIIVNVFWRERSSEVEYNWQLCLQREGEGKSESEKKEGFQPRGFWYFLKQREMENHNSCEWTCVCWEKGGGGGGEGRF